MMKEELYMDMEEIELTILHIVGCEKLPSADTYICRIEPLLKWDILKEATKAGISERRAREALNYLERKGYFDYDMWKKDLYVLSAPGMKYFEKLVDARKKT